MIKNIVFDIGNVLAGFQWEVFYKSFGFSEEIYEKVINASVKNLFWREMDLGILSDEELVNGFVQNDPSVEKELRLVLSNMHGIMKKYDYSVPWVKELKKRGYGVYYISNYSGTIRRSCPEVLDFLEEMDGGIFSYEDNLVKPCAEIFRLFLERYHLQAEECVFIDDTEENVIAAKKEGMKAIHFHTRNQVCEELEKVLKNN